MSSNRLDYYLIAKQMNFQTKLKIKLVVTLWRLVIKSNQLRVSKLTEADHDATRIFKGNLNRNYQLKTESNVKGQDSNQR